MKRDAEIVRCGNCEHRPTNASQNVCGATYCEEFDTYTEDDDYCSRGKRKEDKQ